MPKPKDHPDVDYSGLSMLEKSKKASHDLYTIFYLTRNKGLDDVEIGYYARSLGLSGYGALTLDCAVRGNIYRWNNMAKKEWGQSRMFRAQKRPGESKGKYYWVPEFSERIFPEGDDSPHGRRERSDQKAVEPAPVTVPVPVKTESEEDNKDDAMWKEFQEFQEFQSLNDMSLDVPVFDSTWDKNLECNPDFSDPISTDLDKLFSLDDLDKFYMEL